MIFVRSAFLIIKKLTKVYSFESFGSFHVSVKCNFLFNFIGIYQCVNHWPFRNFLWILVFLGLHVIHLSIKRSIRLRPNRRQCIFLTEVEPLFRYWFRNLYCRKYEQDGSSNGLSQSCGVYRRSWITKFSAWAEKKGCNVNQGYITTIACVTIPANKPYSLLWIKWHFSYKDIL